MKRTILLAAAALILAGCGDDEERAEPQGPPTIELEMQDDSQLLYASPQGIRDAVTTMRALGVDRVRITAGWGILAPEPASTRRPAFDATDSAAYPQPNWLILDRAVMEVTRQGLDVMLDASFWAPRWATARDTGCPDRCRWQINPIEFGHFAEALARRYNGDFKSPLTGRELPQVRLWTTWNEPNHATFLLPQQVRRNGEWVVAAAHNYRAMHERGLAAIKRVSEDNRVLVGGLASLASKPPSPSHTSSPLLWLREFACVDRALRPLRRRPECRDFRPIVADGFAYHPYTRKSPPGRPLPNRDDAGISDLDRLAGLLGGLHRRGRLAQRLEIYVTEFGYETDPPDPKRGIPINRQPAYLNEAAAILLRRRDVRMMSQFLLRDLPQDRLFQTGLILPDGRPKPAIHTFKLPFWIFGREAVGRVYPAPGRTAVTLERRAADGSWRALGKPIDTDANGVLRRRLAAPGTYRMRWGREVSLPAAAR